MYHNLQQHDVRLFFFDVYDKYINNQTLAGVELLAIEVIQSHQEYINIMENKDKYLEYQWHPEIGEINPFLHMSMHISIREQITIDQPIGILDYYNRLLKKYQDKLVVEHYIMDCLAEMIWHGQKNNTPFDSNIYFQCLEQKL
jgi:hypothetical protein